ncbi:gliding motility-associated C-terminal domain-containing protein [Flavobacterium sp. B183]|uniref:Ig-like domain-containing protein n=1 Tax=Flavobacterium sp. B183 TaxID=907046 RepID=UPI00201EDB2A|nr:gliding motility-associated C-terminal domain-containing protein [Flavobacterium sp. B183]URC11141.1 gliding motility-associated C-terminal domain-containing protein [Flavobacterium sp. B183]
MKKNFTFYDLLMKRRLLGLIFLLLFCNENFAQTFCRPISQTNSRAGVCLGTTEVLNPTFAYDANTSTYASLTNALGVLCSVQETVKFSQMAKAGDQIVIVYGSNADLLDVGLLSNATIQPSNSVNSTSSTALALNSPLLNVNAISGATTGTIKYTLTADSDQVKVEIGGLLSVLTNIRIYDVRLEFAKPTITGGATQSVCVGQSIALTATPAAGTTLAWYSSPTSTTALSSVNTFTTPALTTSTTYYIGITRSAGCESDERFPVTINVLDPVLPTISTVGTSICSSGATQATTLSVINPVLGTTYSWYSAPTGGVALSTGSTYTPTVPTGVTNFYVEASIGSCVTPTRTLVTVTSTPVPGVATILTQSVSILSGQNATLSASTAEAGVTLDWYDVPTGGTKLLGDSNTFTTPILVATKTYYVESRTIAGGCVSATRAPVTVTVLANPLGGCLEANSQQTTQNGLCLLCSSSAQNNSVDGNSTTASSITLPVGLVNGWIQQTLQFNNPGKTGDFIDVDLELPGGIADLSLLGAVSLATYNGATYNNDRTFINNALVTLQLLSGDKFRATITAGANFDRVEVRLGGLVSALTTLKIYQATHRYKLPSFTGNTTICGGQTTTLTANIVAGETIKWYDALTGGTLLASTAAYTTPALTANTTYYVEVTRDGCVNSERNPVTVTVNNPIAPGTVVASPLNLCSGTSTTITIQSPVAGTVYKWYDASSGGNLVFTGTVYNTPNLTATTTYYVEASIASCISATRTPVTVNVNPRPSAPVAVSSPVIIQSGQDVTLAVVTNPGIKHTWYDVPTGGTFLATNVDSFTPSPALTASKTFYVEAVDLTSDCTSSTRTAIVVTVISGVNNCLLANSQITTKGGTTNCLTCSSSADGNSVDGNNATAATLSIPIGLVTDHIQQDLTFPTTGQTGDIIDVELGIPVGLLDISALSNVSLQSFNSGVPNGDFSTINNLLNVQILSGNRFKASFAAAGTFTSVRVRLNGLATVLSSLEIYEASYRFANAVITGNATPICAGQTASLTASAAGGDTFVWYDAPTGGNIVAVNPTAALSATTTFYLEATRGGTCINTVRQAVTVTVLPLPTASDINITSPVTASCAGGIVLTPSSPLAGATFKYYLDASKTQEATGTIAGVTYSKDLGTGALTISGLTALNAPYTYYVSVLNGGICENASGFLKEVVVNFPTGTALTVTPTLSGCAKVSLKDAITNFDTSGNTTYTFFDAGNNPITDQAASNITANGNYFIQAQLNGGNCPSVKLPVAVTVNPLPTLTVLTNSVAVTKGSSVALTATSNGTITWYDQQGNVLPSNNTGVLNTVGVFAYTVVASNGTCTVSQTITISVIDPAACDTLQERVYANTQSSGTIITGGVTNGPLAADNDPSTYSTITTGLGLLGIGTTWQNLQWPTTIAKGTPVTVKLGLENSLLAVAQSISVVGTKRDGSNNPIDIGTLQSVTGSLLNLLPGQNSFEYTFVPSNASGLQDYDGIRVQLGSVLSVAQNINVYDTYYKREVAQITCGQGDIEDVFSGVKDLGIGALTATVGVSNPWNIADKDIATYATMFNAVGVLAASELTATFRTPSMVGDSLRIVISKPGTVLNLNLLTGFTIQLYSGNIPVGGPIANTSSLLTLKLLSGDTMAMTIVAPQTQPYDKVVITYGGVATVLDQLRVHSVDRTTNTEVIGADPDNKITVCPGANLTLVVPPKPCADYAWYDSPTGGNLLASGQTYTLPATLAAGTYKYYIQPIRYGCPALERGEVTVTVRATVPAATITNVTINGGSATIICSESGTVTLDAVLSATPVLTNPVYHWYSFDGTTSQPIPGQVTSKLIVTGLLPGTYTYYVGVSSDEYCETAPADRKQVTFTILPSSLVSDISINNASICHDTPAVLTPSSTLTNPVFSWYLDANKTQPIFSGTIGGVTYAISGSGVLTATGLTPAMSPMIYYVAVSSDFTCQNKNGELRLVTVLINDPGTPTSTTYNQNFCLISNPTVANLQADQTNVVWYSAATGGVALNPTTALANGTYYGAIRDVNGCESSVRSVVTVIVNDPGTPVITKTTQDFCLVNAPTFASIDVSPAVAANIVWYTALTGGTLIPSTTALTTGVYYAAIKDPTTLCESNVRLAITINVTDPGTPVITETTQNFCLVNAPTFASINVSPAVAANIVWYTALTGGVLIPSTTALTTGVYYAAIKDPTTLCESNVRLAITINVTDPGTPVITKTTQDFCLVNAPTFASIDVSPAVAANIVWYTALTGGTLIPSTTALTTGVYYAAIKDPTTLCESNVRLAITINVTDPGTPTLVTAGTQNFCLVNAPTFASVQFNEANIVWYTALTGGTVIPSTTALTSGTYFAVIKDPTTLCESAVRLAVVISVTDPGTPTLVTAGTQNFCLVNAPTFASVQFNEANIVWYTALTGGTVIPSTTALTSGTYYAVIKDPVTNCESAVRLAVVISVTDPGTPTLVTAGTQNFCLVNAPTFASVQFNEANIVWYTALTGGTVIPSTTALTSGTYYAVIKDPVTNCESAVRLAVVISVTDPGTPTLVTAGTQNFCLVNAPTFASVQFNEANIVWYTALTGGTVIPSTTALTSGTYYAVIKDPVTNCESAVRLAVVISVTDPGTPTLVTAGTQNFCLVNAPTFASVQFNEANIVWYTALTGGTVIPSTTALTSGTYYAVIKDPVTNCESAVRLAVVISVTDPGTPTLVTAGTQNFCLVNAPTFASVQFNEANIVWYTALTGGTVIPSTTALTSGTYYAVIKDPVTNCESAVRLAVTISVTDPGTPVITETTQNFCLVNAPTFASINVSPAVAANIVWYTALTGGTLIPSTTALTTGVYYAAIKDPVTLCESAVRLAITISVTDPGTPVITETTQNFCLVNAPTFASIDVSPAVAANIVWYTALTGGTLIPSTTALTTGVYYAAIKDPITNCESNVRLAITISVTDPGTPTLVTAGTQNFCLVNAPTFASVQFNQANIVWYTALTGGTVIPSTTALTSGTYYAVIKDPITNCESAVRLAVVISVTDPGTPTLVTAGTQNFCLVNAPTFASVQFNEANIVWYTALTGGTVIPSTTALTSGTYYAVIKDPITNCESAVRLAVVISVTDPGTPTLVTAGTQNFCLVNAPTFASVQFNEANIVWYTALTGGTVIPSTTALTSGTYYAVIKDPITNCESAVRLAVTISVTDPGTPVITNTTQNFCLVNAPTFASIDVSPAVAANIVWYTTLTGGVLIPSTTALTTGVYYAAIKDPTTLCESAVRLAITINVTDPGTPVITKTTQNFCLFNAPTFASIDVSPAVAANIVWYTALTGGILIPSTTALTSGTYYAAIKDPVTLCESNVRLAIVIIVTDPEAPIITKTTQDFCLVNAPTFATIDVSPAVAANIVWYTALTGGTVIPSTTALTTGIYYAAVIDPVSGCESTERLPITINVTDPGTPTLVTAGTQNFCLANAPTFASVQFNQANIVWYTAITGGTVIAPTTALTSGTYYAVIKDPVTNCESAIRLAVTINVANPGTPTLVTAGTQNFCLANTPTFASVQFNQVNIVWYTALTGGTVIPSTTALTSGTYYAVIKDPVSGCESAVRLAVTINVSDPGTPTLVTAGVQNFCLVNAPTFASVQFNQANIVWYTALTGGAVIPSTTALISGTYYAVIKDPVSGCESAERLAVTISVTDPGTPTLVTAGTQNFCLVNAPTFASVQFNQANIVWYTALTGGTVIAATTALTSGTYYAVIKDPVTNCESAVRLAVTINVANPGTPTLVTAGTQTFCTVNAPTFASVQFNQANIVWYTALTGGTVIPSTTALTSGTYYAVIKDPVSGCESAVRLTVNVNVIDPGTPTTTAATQVFCSGNNPTVANIQVNGSNIVWYTTATGGTVIAGTTPLVNGDYYAAIKDPVSGCESSVRLKVTVTVGISKDPTTTAATQNFCSTSAPTFANIQVNESNVAWFSSATGGTAIPLTTALTSGTYYGELTDPVTGCKSANRLQVVITIVTPMATPTTNAATQNFCSVDAPKVSNIQVNESGVIWYSTPTGGTAIPATTALATGTYYGVIASSSGCENPIRLAVAVTVNVPLSVTTPRTTQVFCLSAAPTVQDIVVNEANIVWYTTASGGTPLAANTPLVAATYYAAAQGNITNGCGAVPRLAVIVTFNNDALVPITTTDDTPCVFQGVTYSIANGKSNYVWSVSNGTITSGGGLNDGSVTISWSDIGPGKVEVEYINTCNERTTKSLNVIVATCSDLTITNTVSNPKPNFGDQITFTITVNNIGQGNFINTIVSDLLPSGYNLISASATAGTYSLLSQIWTIPTLNAGQSVVLTIVAEVLPGGKYLSVATVETSTPLDVDSSNNSASVSVEPICLTVYNEFTPNNDGANDLFRIDCIETYPNNELKVYNRYGSLVYSKQHYENDWDGTANVSGVINRGDMLPTGTYFYVIAIGDGTVKKGWLSIMR